MFASVSFADKAFYDSETGTAVIPEILIDGQPHSIILQQNEDLSFDVIEKTQISENLSLQKKKGGGASINNRGECHPNNATPGKTPARAKELFSMLCDVAYDDQKGHHCDWEGAGWICYGRPADTTTIPITDLTDLHWSVAAVYVDGNCHTNVSFSTRALAIYVYEQVCHAQYSHSRVGDYCAWLPYSTRYPSGTPLDTSRPRRRGGFICYGFQEPPF